MRRSQATLAELLEVITRPLSSRSYSTSSHIYIYLVYIYIYYMSAVYKRSVLCNDLRDI